MSDPIRSSDANVDTDDVGLFVSVRSEPPVHLVSLTGELDLCSRSIAKQACVSTDLVHVVVDLSGLEFMDCAGYGALAAATTEMQRRGGSLVLAGAVGEPQRLLHFIGELDRATVHERLVRTRREPTCASPAEPGRRRPITARRGQR